MSKKTEDLDKEEGLVNALINNANNFGPPRDMFHPDYGWIILNGETTEVGKEFFKEQMEQFQKSHAYVGNC